METRTGATVPVEAIPPWEPRTVYVIGGVGAGLAALAALLGTFGTPSLDPFRLAAAGLGVLVAGIAVWLRSNLPAAWLLAAAACGLAVFGFPTAWDSAWRLSMVFGVVALLAAGLVMLSWKHRVIAFSVLIFIHFGGILAAVLGPQPQAWLAGQAWIRLYRPYLQFMYLNNAYQFYSPDPGPAILVWACVKYKTDEDKIHREWYRFPRRPEQLRDPLAMTYYRRLSLTEQVNPAGQNPSALDWEEIDQRRKMRNDVPLNTPSLDALAYRPPAFELQERVIPEYVRFIAREMEKPDMTIESIKFYRIEHRIVAPMEFGNGLSPYDPTTYLPYFFGEFTPQGELIDSEEPLLYWLIPIIRRQTGTFGASDQYGTPSSDSLDDHLSQHAGLKAF